MADDYRAGKPLVAEAARFELDLLLTRPVQILPMKRQRRAFKLREVNSIVDTV